MITITFGTGGTYATLRTALLALPAFSDDVTLLQVGDSDDGSSSFSINGFFLNGRSLTVRSQLPNNGSRNSGYRCRFGASTFLGAGAGAAGGSMILEDVYFLCPSLQYGSAISIGATTSTQNFVRIKNSILEATTNSITIVTPNLQAIGGPPWVVTGNGYVEIANSKFYAPSRALLISPGNNPSRLKTSLIIENCAFHTYQSSASGYGLTRGDSSFFPWMDVATRNCVFLVHSSHKAHPDIGNVINCARSVSVADGNAYLNDALAVPGDILSTTLSDDTCMNTAPASALYTAGDTPQLAINPYTTAPYPVGIYYAAAYTPSLILSGLMGQVANRPAWDASEYGIPRSSFINQLAAARIIAAPASGVASILPDATAKISHARILRADRTPDQARKFHDLIREGL